MVSDKIKEKLDRRETMLGILSLTTDPAICEFIGRSGFDLYMIDGEHGQPTLAEVAHLVRACETTRMPCLARVRSLDEKLILQYLDLGVCGIMMPGIKTAAEVERFVSAVKYPPLGKRGIAGVRAADYLMGPMSQAEYVAYANRATIVLPQIETAECVENLDEILAVEGVDGFIIGPRDLAMAMGYREGPGHPEAQAMVHQLMQRVLAAGKAVGTTAFSPEQAKILMDKGATILLNSVQALLSISAKQYLSIR